MGDNNFNLPPGFRFQPTDEELVIHFLHRKAALLPCHPDVIPDLDLYPYDPWDLDGKAMAEGNKWYFYSRRTHSRERVTESGYWQSIGVEEPIISTGSGLKVGMKKYSAFFLGHPSEEESVVKTNWVMHEYRMSDSSRRKKTTNSQWVVCRVQERDGGSDDGDGGAALSCLDEVFLSLDDLDEISLPY